MRCGNCMKPHYQHIKRQSAAWLCPGYKGVYREATDAELEEGYRAEFPNGPEPIATFRADNPGDVERLKSIFGREALAATFGPGGGGLAEINAKLQSQGNPA